MGIPSYFSYIIKNHSNIIRNFGQCPAFQRLYMDCNSIVYDSYYTIEAECVKKDIYPSPRKIEEMLINRVLDQIQQLVSFVSPSELVYIAFDGVAPFAKMSQQRTRRFKSSFAAEKKMWNTTAITPGTLFMKKLCDAVYDKFPQTPSNSVGGVQWIVSCSDKPGEGEHKLYQHIREHPDGNVNIGVYGLDSDLIMLSILHQTYCNGIFVFREAPEFAKSLSQFDIRPFLPKDTTNKQPLLFIDIVELSVSIFETMTDSQGTLIIDPQTDLSNIVYKMRIYDYIFICFLLGNDFLPHFPALNIRTHGIQILLDSYKMIIGKDETMSIIDCHTMTIRWENVVALLSEIAKNESKYISREINERETKWGKKYWASNTEDEKKMIIQNAPVMYRSNEKYIHPSNPGWEKRYYRVFHGNEDVDEISRNYAEGLEWTFMYYTGGCPCWEWKYHSDYPPLFSDLTAFIKRNPQPYLQPSKSPPATAFQQLTYVLPYKDLDLLPKRMCDKLRGEYSDYYPVKWGFKWGFCRYLWEAHPDIPDMPLQLLKRM